MNYRQRMKWSLVAAAVVHVAALAVPLGLSDQNASFRIAPPDQPPIMVTFDKKPTPTPKQLILGGTPADVPVDPQTDLIAEQATKASDLSKEDNESNKRAPHVETIGEVDQLSRPAPAPSPAPKAAAPPSQNHAEKPEARPPRPAQRASIKEARAALTLPSIPVPPVAPGPAADGSIKTAPQASPGAGIDPTRTTDPTPSDAPTGITQSRIDGGVKGEGFISFEAMQDDFAPYLRQVRERVERRWKAIMHVRYTGTSQTQAVVDCSIGPDGTLKSVDVVKAGDSATYAALCKEAIEKAGPFAPFPFNVPDMYRSKNLEIRWTFSFLD